MTTIRELWVRLGANTDKASVQAFDAALANVKKTGTAVVKTLGALTATAGAAAFGLFKLVRQTADAADAAAKGAQKYGLTTESFQELEHAAKLSGGTIGQVGVGLKNLARQMDDANRGGKASAKIFKDMKIATRDANGQLRAADDVLMDVAERVANATTTTDQMAIATKALGRSGVELLPMLRKGRKGIEEMREEAKDGVISAEAAKQFEAFNDDLLRGRRILDGWRNTLAQALLPKVHDLVKSFIGWARANREVIKSKIEQAAKRIGEAMDLIVSAAKYVNDQVEKWGGWEAMFKRLGKALALMGIMKIVGQVGALGIAVKGLIALLVKGGIAVGIAFIKPILIGLAIIAVIAAIVLGVQDLMTFMRGGESVIGRFFEKFGMAEQVKGVFSAIGNAVKQLGRLMLAWGKLILRSWTIAFRAIWFVVGPIFKLLGAVVLWWWQNITLPVLSAVADMFAWVFGGIADGLEYLDTHWDAIMGAIKMMASDAAQWVRDKIGGAIQWVRDMIDKMMGGLKKAGDIAAKLNPANAARGIMGRVSQAFAPTTNNNPRTQPRQNTMNASSTVNVTVEAKTGASPEEIASVTSKKTGDEIARQNRLTQASFAGGEL
ncbi:MAG: hypothetical protein ACNA8W_02340 [Bradymonadaceae bacterium]